MKNLELITTTYVNQKLEKKSLKYRMVPDKDRENELITIYPELKHQVIEGFGGAFTDAAGYTYSKMTAEHKKELLEAYFGENGAGYTMARIPIDSCDYAVGYYEAMSDKDDVNFQGFTLERTEKYILPLLEDAQKILGRPIEILFSPWSPPVFMKTNGKRNDGGKLKKEYRKFWAEYLCKYITEFRKRGYAVKRLTVQNEPNAVQIWDSCIYNSEEEKEFIRDFLFPALVKNGLSDVEIFVWDHNKERIYERLKEIVDEDTDKMVAGVAFHWYSGDHFEAVNAVRERFPGKQMILSEAGIGPSSRPEEDFRHVRLLAHEMIGDFNHGMTAFYDWNIFLDETGGPNHVENFGDAPLMYDTVNKKIIKKNLFECYKHFSCYIMPGAVNITSSRFCQELDVAAFENPDGTLAAVIYNSSSEEIKAYIRVDKLCAEVTIAPDSISTGIITSSPEAQ